MVEVSPEPDAMLWALWAAKEAAHKAWARQNPLRPFSPGSLSVEFLPGQGLATVRHGGSVLPVRWTRGIDWVHAVTGNFADLVVRVEKTSDEPSLAVRTLAIQTLRDLGGPSAVVQGRPPEFQFANAPSRAVSLSHDGPYIAVAFRWPTSGH